MGKKIMEWWNNLDKRLKIGLIVLVIVVIGISIAFRTQPDKYQVLYSNLDSKDSTAITKELVRTGVDYQIADGGATIQIDSTNVAQVRMNLAALGLPRNGNPGLELMGNSSIGETQFDKNIKYQRALKGQIEQDLVNGIDGVENATVTLSLVDNSSIFRDKSSNSKATVVVSMGTGKALDESQIKGIQNFIAGAVPDLNAKDVVVLDDKGTMLSDFSGDETNTTGNLSKQQQIVAQTEDRVKNDIMDSLSKVFGYDHVTINVRANINFDEIVQKIEKYDPKGTLVSSEKHSDIAKKVDGTSTEPGTSANGEVPNYNTSTASNGVLSEDKEDLIENFDVGKTVETIKQNPELTNLNVVVWIDKTMQANEISTISKAVAVSAGLKDTNNDGVYENGEVQVIPVFFNQNLQKSQNQQAETEKGLLETLFGSKLTAMIVFGIIGLAFVLLTIFVILARRKGKETDGEGNIVSKRKIVSKETINQNDVTNINNIREINNEERTMDENLLTKISDAKKKAVVIEGDEDSETVKRQKTITEKAKEVAGKDPQKTSEFIKKLISEG